jgi:beta-glucosidase
MDAMKNGNESTIRSTWKAVFCCTALMLSSVSFCPAQTPSNAQLAEKKLNVRVDALLRQMTLQEKIGQLTQYSAGAPTGPGTGRDDEATMVAKGEVGSLLNAVGAEKANRYQHIAMEKTRLHIPLIFGYDVIHGQHTTFPVPLALAATFDPELVQATTRMAAEEARADGIEWVFSPMVDIARDARWGRIVESNGADPYLGSAMARAYVRGYQQDDLSKPTSVAVSVKHFAAYGAPVAGRDYNAVDMSELTLRQVYLPPYHAAVEAGAATIMSSFNSLNGVPETANPFTLTQVLRHEWGFNGLVVSDWGAVRELLAHGVALEGATAARKALTAGVDMDMEGDLYRTRLAGLVQNGELPESVIDEAARRVLRVKFALGLFEHPYTEVTPAYAPTAEKRTLARKAAEESLVLLKNDAVEGWGKVLPLRPGKSIALIGPLADSKTDMLGSWFSAGNPDDAVTLKTALEQGHGAKGKLLYAKGTEILGDSDAGFADALKTAQQADVVVMALGEAGGMTGEATSRAHLDLPGNQEKLLEAVAATGKPLVLVVFNGHPLALPWAAKHVPAIVEAWFPGLEAGPAISNVLFGETNPSGKLPVDLPRSVGQEPLYYAQMATGRPAAGTDLSHPPITPAEQYVSRYLDEDNAAQFPFGWGLSYTRFTYSVPKLNTQQVPLSSTNSNRGTPLIKVNIDVQNSGPVAGTEVAQLYMRNLGASVEQPVRELKGFQKVTLQPGETKHLEFTLTFDELAFYNAQLLRVIEPTKYTVWVGGSSLADQEASFEVK